MSMCVQLRQKAYGIPRQEGIPLSTHTLASPVVGGVLSLINYPAGGQIWSLAQLYLS